MLKLSYVHEDLKECFCSFVMFNFFTISMAYIPREHGSCINKRIIRSLMFILLLLVFNSIDSDVQTPLTYDPLVV